MQNDNLSTFTQSPRVSCSSFRFSPSPNNISTSLQSDSFHIAPTILPSPTSPNACLNSLPQSTLTIISRSFFLFHINTASSVMKKSVILKKKLKLFALFSAPQILKEFFYNCSNIRSSDDISSGYSSGEALQPHRVASPGDSLLRTSSVGARTRLRPRTSTTKKVPEV